MLRQNINLYTAFRASTIKLKHLSWRHFVLGSIAFFALLILSHIFNISDLYYQKYRLASLNTEISQLQSQIESKKTQYPTFFFSENVAKTVGELEKNMRLEAELLSKIANRISFSDILISLANIDVGNVWLTEVSIEDGGNVIKLAGNALTLPDVKLYFAQIENNIFFKHDHLTVDKIEHAPKDNYAEFQNFLISIAKTNHEQLNS